MLSIDPKFIENHGPENLNFEIWMPSNFTRAHGLSGEDYEWKEKFAIAHRFESQKNDHDGKSQRAFAASHGLAESTLRGWLTHYRNYEKTGVIRITKKGRRPLLEPEHIPKLAKRVAQGVDSQNTPTRADFCKLIIEFANIANAERGMPACVNSISDQTIANYGAKIQLETATVQHKTHARIVAENDPRNALSMHALVKAFSTDLAPTMIGNFDATQYVVSQERPDQGYYIKQERLDDKPLTAESSGGLDFAIKFYHVHNAAGFTSTPVFNIADGNMGEEDADFYTISGLGTNGTQRNFGYLCFTKTRACNKKFYDWFAKQILIPFVVESRESIDAKVSNINYFTNRNYYERLTNLLNYNTTTNNYTK